MQHVSSPLIVIGGISYTEVCFAAPHGQEPFIGQQGRTRHTYLGPEAHHVNDCTRDNLAGGSSLVFCSFHFVNCCQGGRVGIPDGVKVDDKGNVFATAPGGVAVISPDGEHLGTVFTGGVFTANVALGGNGYLYMAASEYIMRVKVLTEAPTVSSG